MGANGFKHKAAHPMQYAFRDSDPPLCPWLESAGTKKKKRPESAKPTRSVLASGRNHTPIFEKEKRFLSICTIFYRPDSKA